MYRAAWRALAWRRGVAIFLLCGLLPACVALYVLAESEVLLPEVAALLAIVWVALAIAAVWWAGEFRCPRCSRRYAALGGGSSASVTRGLFEKICDNCKLAKFETGDSDGA